MEPKMKSILPEKDTHPYYIFAPSYTRFSAGVRVLHLLCHWLNKSGYQASIFDFNQLTTGPDLLTPLLDEETVQRHFREGRTPIVIYPKSWQATRCKPHAWYATC